MSELRDNWRDHREHAKAKRKAVSIDEAGARKYIKREPRWHRMRGRA